MAYTKRTCNKCGYRDIQPNMVQKEIEYVSGTSNTGLSARTVVGSVLGSKKSSNQLGKWLIAPNKRVYKRKRMVWMCKQCVSDVKSNGSLLEAIVILFQGLLGLAIIGAVIMAIGALVGYILGIPL